MELITIRKQIEAVAAAWDRQYPPQFEQAEDTQEISRRLHGLDKARASPEEVAAIIGNGSWVTPKQCDECGDVFDDVVQVGQPEDYDSNTVTICLGCAAKAVGLFAALRPYQGGDHEN